MDDAETVIGTRRWWLRLASPAVAAAILFPWSAMTIPKGLSILFVFTGICGFYFALRKGVIREIFPQPLSAVLGVFLLVGFAMCLHSFDGNGAFSLWFRLAGGTMAGLGTLWLFKNLSPTDRRLAENGFLLGVGAALIAAVSVLLLWEWAGFALLGWNRIDPLLVLAPGLVVMSIINIPVCMLLWRRGWRVGAVTYPVLLLIILLPMTTNIAILAVGVGVVFLLFGLLFTRLPAIASAAFALLVALLILILSVNFLKSFSENRNIGSTFPFVLMEENFIRSIQHRFQIWDFTAGEAMERPVLGWGLDASRRHPEGRKKTFLGESILPLHPHNGVLQVWFELGLAGLCAFLALIICVIRKIQNQPTAIRLALAAMFASGFTVHSLAFGIWQSWWLASIWFCAALISSLLSEAESHPVSDS